MKLAMVTTLLLSIFLTSPGFAETERSISHVFWNLSGSPISGDRLTFGPFGVDWETLGSQHKQDTFRLIRRTPLSERLDKPAVNQLENAAGERFKEAHLYVIEVGIDEKTHELKDVPIEGFFAIARGRSGREYLFNMKVGFQGILTANFVGTSVSTDRCNLLLTSPRLSSRIQ